MSLNNDSIMIKFLKWALIAPTTVVLFIALIFIVDGKMNQVFGCSIDRKPVVKKITDHLKKINLDDKYLKEDPDGDDGCNLSYIYKSETEHIHFVVIEGYKLTYWDYNKRG
ncbi:hypothetical protein RGQ13_15355 [Thalassotalea psychrophila]|uniref:Uncharacterized protein n=1 Tax=Thalassotalea psychrophila TaxID=3065647 RepID=A0ABY9TT48_9GAMM|nr:hypothetical protein RGQ13_15355 [Colwelliaceae bacterium SQ149]